MHGDCPRPSIYVLITYRPSICAKGIITIKRVFKMSCKNNLIDDDKN